MEGSILTPEHPTFKDPMVQGPEDLCHRTYIR